MHEDGRRYSRRDVLQKSALATGAVLFGGTALSGTAAAGVGDGRVGHYNLNNLHLNKDTDEKIKNFVHDASPAKNHGTNYGAELVKDGAVGKAFRFSGDTDYVDIPANSSLSPSSNEITIAAWIKAEETQSGAASGIVTKDDLDGDREWNLHLSSASKPTPWSLRCRIIPLDDTDRVDGTTDLRDNSWHHVAGRWNGSELSVWVDGQKENYVCTDGELSATDANVRIGNFADDGTDILYNFDGKIDEARVYNRALSDGEIYELYDMRD